jgi:hypothetical protein
MSFLSVLLMLLYWPHGLETAPALKEAGVEQILVPPDQVEAWNKAGFKATPLTEAELAARTRLSVPRIAPRSGVASPTRAPWVDANGWRLVRKSGEKFYYELPRGRAALAAAEAFAYDADAVLKIDPADLADFGKMMNFLQRIPQREMTAVADLAIVDDGSTLAGEVMNLLSRRNLLYRVVTAPAPQFKINIQLGAKEYPREDAADPSAFALKIRRQLGDENRALRVYGSEVVISRLTSDGRRARLHLLNYGGREIEGLRVRVRGAYARGEAAVYDVGQTQLSDYLVTDGATEFTLPRLTSYAVVDLTMK